MTGGGIFGNDSAYGHYPHLQDALFSFSDVVTQIALACTCTVFRTLWHRQRRSEFSIMSLKLNVKEPEKVWTQYPVALKAEAKGSDGPAKVDLVASQGLEAREIWKEADEEDLKSTVCEDRELKVYTFDFADVVVGSLGDTIVVEVGTALAWDLGNKVATDVLFHKASKLLPDHAKLLTTTSVKELTVTIKYKHSNLTDATLGFFRASSVVHPDPSLFATVGQYLSTQKGWFAPYLQATARRPVIPRNFSPDMIYSHGPFLAGDYALATRLTLEAATVINLSPPHPTPSPTSTPDDSMTPPKNMLVTLVGIAPHRFGMWTSSARPGESVVKYQLLNGCPALVLPVLPGSPLIAWNTLTLETIHGYRTELDAAGSVKPSSKKFNGMVDSIFEFLSLCIDWARLQLPEILEGTEAGRDIPTKEEKKKSCVRDAVALIVEGAVRSGLPASLKILKKDVELDRAGIAMWRMP
ncbi:hypothetical protein P7C70_g5017, partial [Phenoliferia sp. Uapishka_3]